ncbi:LysR family transcriptional regulator [Hydrogenophaga sp. PAMC20947]|uniref:LysR family transcriptional regulator n=1 Tax=Hydrogenophaga sp. PAMC20947 TaxID=2565558 RepID=UPI00109E15E6|nr:LysR family transcriptional regulator [Hydrogenophaga sp. PAMC20947]QCB47747.1 LysR family transcriptional regulator [Hydrogenophaga sp. PAMC20947]
MQHKAKALIGQMADVDLRLLRVFRAVADCGGMAAAELELNLAMSTISRHVKDLETRLGLVLCRRGRSGFALTPEGTQVYAAAQHLLAATDAFRGQLHDIHRRMGGDLHVALFEKTASNPASHIPQAIRQFRDIAPQVHLHLHVGPIGMIERGVIDGQYHLGIIPEHRRSESLDYLDLFGETMQLYASADHPWVDSTGDAARDWTALSQQQLAALGYHSPNMALTHARRLERAATASDQEAVATLVLSGAYVGFLPDHYARQFVEAGQMRAVAPAVLRYDCRFACIWRHAPGPLRMAQAFLQALQSAHMGA